MSRFGGERGVEHPAHPQIWEAPRQVPKSHHGLQGLKLGMHLELCYYLIAKFEIVYNISTFLFVFIKLITAKQVVSTRR